MAPLLAALWGLAGGLCVEGLDLYARIHRGRGWSWRRPIPQGWVAFVLSVGIRSGVGAILAAATAASGQVEGAFAAFALGVGAPLVIERLARAVPVAGPPEAPPPPRSAPETEVTGDPR
ncbi:hypothetical protein [Actinomadura sp. 9N215]|uniref:hypothetical protein n=1 Tax=Actinomadura sp. 9N215 TaxID=3375150 RepID=UPI0037A96315